MKIYRVDNTVLCKDDSAHYSSLNWFYDFTNTRTLGADKYAMAKDLLKQIPIELFSKNRIVIGCPDCNDQGGIFMEIMSGPAIVRLKLDINDTPDQTKDIISFKQKLLAVVKKLQ
jgi:hypothetical protein